MAIITTGLTITSSYGSWYFGDLPLKADQQTSDQFCKERGYTSGGTFTSDGGKWSNDGGRLMNHYVLVGLISVSATTNWVNYFGYDGIITSITEP